MYILRRSALFVDNDTPLRVAYQQARPGVMEAVLSKRQKYRSDRKSG
jgi:hypothetical protein